MLEPTKMRGIIKDFDRLAVLVEHETGERFTGRTLRNYSTGPNSPPLDRWKKIEKIVRREIRLAEKDAKKKARAAK